MFIAAKILNKPFKEIFYNLGYSYAPLFIFASLGHALSGFFTRGYERIVEGFAWAFGMSIKVEPLAKRGDDWLMIFSAFKWIAIFWALVILYKRMKLIKADKIKKIVAFPFAAMLILFYFGVNQYRSYIIDTYGRANSGMHGGMRGMRGMGGDRKLFQSVSKDKAIILQKGKDKDFCAVCGMKLPMFYKTNHAATLKDGKIHQYCSIHCLVKEKLIEHKKLDDIKVVDTKSLKFIDAKTAYYVVGSKKKGTMSKISKYAFKNENDAKEFAKKFGGRVVGFDKALKISLRDFRGGSVEVKPNDTLFFTNRNPSRHGRRMMGMMGMGSRNGEVPSRSFWLVTKKHNRIKCVKNIDGSFYVLDRDGNALNFKTKTKNGCTCITFKVPKNGYYAMYYVLNGKSIVNVVKNEYKRINHGSEEEFKKEKIAPRTTSKVPFDIIRLRDNEDSFYYSLHAGEVLRFKILKDGKPLRGARVTLKTQLGWQKSVMTDKNGIAKLELIQDYNPKWEKFNKRFRESFIVIASYKDRDSGKRYKATFSGTFRPDRETYQSYAYAFVIVTILLVLLVIGIFVYRYRVQKPFREVKFDEE